MSAERCGGEPGKPNWWNAARQFWIIPHHRQTSVESAEQCPGCADCDATRATDVHIDEFSISGPRFTTAELVEVCRLAQTQAHGRASLKQRIKLESAARRLEWIAEVEKGLIEVKVYAETIQHGPMNPVVNIATNLLAKLREI